MFRKSVDKVSKRDNRDKKKNRLGEVWEILFSKKNIVSFTILTLKIVLLIVNRFRSKSD